MIALRNSCAVCCVLLLWATAGCVDAKSAKPDPPIKAVEGPAGRSSSKPGPEKYWVKLDTTRGDVLIEVVRAWAPNGADRFYELVSSGFYDGCRFFRVVPGFMAQIGIHGDPQRNAQWKDKRIPDDHPAKEDLQPNRRGNVTFAMGGPNTRTTQFFINTKTNSHLDGMGFPPFGRVTEGMAVVDSLYGDYGEEPQQSAGRIQEEGNAYLSAAFPKLDSIKKATVLTSPPAAAKASDAKAPANGS